MIEAENVHFAYNGKEVLRGIDFEMGQEIVALVGPNGSGKTTLAKHFNGLLKPSKGRILVDGLDTREHTVAELSRLVGYVFQNPEHMFFEETVFNEVAFGPRNLDLSEEEVEERVRWALRSVGLSGFEERTPYSLSGGEKQRLAIACVLAMKPKYLILDEPTTGLDARAEEEVVNVIRSLHENGHGILLITHDMDLVVRLAGRVVLLHRGRKLFDGPVEEFFTAFDVEKYGLERPEVVELGERLGLGFVRSIKEILARLGGSVIGQFYIRKESFMHSLDPRVKIIGMLLGIITLMLFNQPTLLLALFIGLLILGKVLAGADFSYQFRLLKPLLPIVLITLALWPVIYKPRLEGFFIGIAYSARLLGFALVTFLLLMTTTQKELVLGFVRLGLPYELGLTLTIALRYIPTLYWLARTIMDAQRSRGGLELDKGNLLVRMRKITAVLIPLIVASLKTAHELSIALESRAFGASKKRTFLRDLEMKPRDYAVLALLLVGFALALYTRYVLGFGHVNLYQGGA